MSLSDRVTKQYEGTTQTTWEVLSVEAVKDFIREESLLMCDLSNGIINWEEFIERRNKIIGKKLR